MQAPRNLVIEQGPMLPTHYQRSSAVCRSGTFASRKRNRIADRNNNRFTVEEICVDGSEIRTQERERDGGRDGVTERKLTVSNFLG